MAGTALIWDLIARDAASPAFNRVATSADRAAVATARAEKGIASSATGISKSMKLMGAAVGAFAIGDLIGHAVSDATKFQAAMTKIQTQAGASAKQVAGFSKSILSLSPKVATAPDDLALSLYHVYSSLKKLGADGPQMLNAVKIAAQGAKVGGSDLESTTNALTATMASGIVPFNQAAKAMATLNAIVGAGDMKMQDLNDALGTGILASMKVFGVSLKDSGAALAVFGDQNIRGADAATKLRMAVQDLAKPAAHADDVLKKIHLTTDQLRTSLETQGLSGTLDLLKKKMTEFGVTGSKVGGFLEDAFTKKAGVGLAILTNNLKQFHEAQDQEQSGINKWGASVKATYATAAVAFQKLGAQVQTFMIELGDKLLPVVTSAAQWLGTNLPKAFHTLGQILAPIAKMVGGMLVSGWHAFVAVARPVVSALDSIGHFLADNADAIARVAKTLAIMWAAWKGIVIARFAIGVLVTLMQTAVVKTAALGEAMVALRTQGITAASGIKAALAGAAIGLTLGNLAKNASGATQAFTVLGSAAAGAAAGFAMGGGGVGAAIGGTAGALGALIPIMDKTTAAEKAMQDGTAAVTAAIRDQNGMITSATRLREAQMLQDTGTAAALAKYGITLKQVTDAETGSTPAMKAIVDTLHAQVVAGKMSRQEFQLQTIVLRQNRGDVSKAVASGKQLATVNAQNAMTAKNYTADLHTLGNAQGNLVGTQKQNAIEAAGVNLSLSQQAIKADGVTTSLKKLNAALEKNISDELTSKSANLGFKESLLTLGEQVKTNGASLSDNTAKGVANRQMLVGLLQSADQAAHGSKNYGAALLGNVQQLIKFSTQAGYSRKSVMDLLKQMHLTPDEIKTEFETNAADEINTVGRLTKALQNLQNKRITYFVNGMFGSIDRTGGKSHPGPVGFASGGSVPDGLSVVGEQGRELLVKHGNKVDILPNSKYRQMAASKSGDMGVLPAFAGGTPDAIAATKSFLHSVNPLPYQWGATGPGAYDCSGLVGAAIEHLTGMGSGRLFSTSNEGSVLPSLGFKSGSGSNAAMVVGWENDANLQHTTGEVGGLRFEAYGDQGVPLGKQIRVGGSARDPRSFPNVMYLPMSAMGGKPGGDPPSGGGGGGGGGPTPKEQRRAQNAQDLRRARYAFLSSQHPHKILERGGHFYLGGQMYNTRALAREALREERVTTAQRKAQEQRQKQHQQHQAIVQALKGFGSFGPGTTPNDARASLRQLEQALKQAGISKKFIGSLDDENKAIVKAVRIRDVAAKNLAKANQRLHDAQQKMRQDRGAFSGAVTGSFDITSAGRDANGRVSGGAMLAQEKQAVTRARKWLKDMKRLMALKFFPAAYIRQLASQGPGALEEVDALLSLPMGQLREFAREERQLQSIGHRTGRAEARRLDKGAVDRARQHRHDVKQREERREKHLEKEMKQFRRELFKEFRQEGFHIDLNDMKIYLASKTGEKQAKSRRGGA